MITQEELIVLIYKKDEKAFKYLYDMYAKSLYAVINVHVKYTEDAEEVLQEVFVKIWKNIDQYDQTKGRLYTWMLAIARDISINKLIVKNANNNPKNLYLDDFVHLLNIKTNYTSKADSIGVQEFTRRLKPKCIQIIDLIFFKAYNQQEVANTLGIPLETVKIQYRSCMINLRNYIKLQ